MNDDINHQIQNLRAVPQLKQLGVFAPDYQDHLQNSQRLITKVNSSNLDYSMSSKDSNKHRIAQLPPLTPSEQKMELICLNQKSSSNELLLDSFGTQEIDIQGKGVSNFLLKTNSMKQSASSSTFHKESIKTVEKDSSSSQQEYGLQKPAPSNYAALNSCSPYPQSIIEVTNEEEASSSMNFLQKSSESGIKPEAFFEPQPDEMAVDPSKQEPVYATKLTAQLDSIQHAIQQVVELEPPQTISTVEGQAADKRLTASAFKTPTHISGPLTAAMMNDHQPEEQQQQYVDEEKEDLYSLDWKTSIVRSQGMIEHNSSLNNQASDQLRSSLPSSITKVKMLSHPNGLQGTGPNTSQKEFLTFADDQMLISSIYGDPRTYDLKQKKFDSLQSHQIVDSSITQGHSLRNSTDIGKMGTADFIPAYTFNNTKVEPQISEQFQRASGEIVQAYFPIGQQTSSSTDEPEYSSSEQRIILSQLPRQGDAETSHRGNQESSEQLNEEYLHPEAPGAQVFKGNSSSNVKDNQQTARESLYGPTYKAAEQLSRNKPIGVPKSFHCLSTGHCMETNGVISKHFTQQRDSEGLEKLSEAIPYTQNPFLDSNITPDDRGTQFSLSHNGEERVLKEKWEIMQQSLKNRLNKKKEALLFSQQHIKQPSKPFVQSVADKQTDESCFVVSSRKALEQNHLNYKVGKPKDRALDSKHCLQVYERNQSWNELREQKKRKLHEQQMAEKEAEELAECSFKPQIIGFNYQKPVTNCDLCLTPTQPATLKYSEQRVEQRCHEWNKQRLVNKVKKEKEILREHIHQCPFEPATNERNEDLQQLIQIPRTPNIVLSGTMKQEDLKAFSEQNNRRSGSLIPSQPKLERIRVKNFGARNQKWQEDQQKKKIKRMNEQASKEEKELTFQPKISKKSNLIHQQKINLIVDELKQRQYEGKEELREAVQNNVFVQAFYNPTIKFKVQNIHQAKSRSRSRSAPRTQKRPSQRQPEPSEEAMVFEKGNMSEEREAYLQGFDDGSPIDLTQPATGAELSKNESTQFSFDQPLIPGHIYRQVNRCQTALDHLNNQRPSQYEEMTSHFEIKFEDQQREECQASATPSSSCPTNFEDSGLSSQVKEQIRAQALQEHQQFPKQSHFVFRVANRSQRKEDDRPAQFSTPHGNHRQMGQQQFR